MVDVWRCSAGRLEVCELQSINVCVYDICCATSTHKYASADSAMCVRAPGGTNACLGVCAGYGFLNWNTSVDCLAFVSSSRRLIYFDATGRGSKKLRMSIFQPKLLLTLCMYSKSRSSFADQPRRTQLDAR